MHAIQRFHQYFCNGIQRIPKLLHLEGDIVLCGSFSQFLALCNTQLFSMSFSLGNPRLSALFNSILNAVIINIFQCFTHIQFLPFFLFYVYLHKLPGI